MTARGVDVAAPAGRSRPTPAGWAARTAVPAAVVGGAFALPAVVPSDAHADLVSLAAILACAALGVNVVLGHLGRLTLGHHALLGVGAFASALLTTDAGPGLPFAVGVVAAAGAGGLAGALVGLLAAGGESGRVAVATLAFAAVAEVVLFRAEPLLEGISAPRPPLLEDPRWYAYLCLVVLAALVVLDWRLSRSKAGRALVVIRDDDRVAVTFGAEPTTYLVAALALSGAMTGLAGALFAGLTGFASGAEHFGLPLGLLLVAVAVVGGVASRVGVVLAAALLVAVAALLEPAGAGTPPIPQPDGAAPSLVAAVLLLVTLVRLPGGIGQLLGPVQRWVRGAPFDLGAAGDPLPWGGDRAGGP